MTRLFIELDFVPMEPEKPYTYKNYLAGEKEPAQPHPDIKLFSKGAKGLFPVSNTLVITGHETGNTFVSLDGKIQYPIVQDFETVKAMLTGSGVHIIEPTAPEGKRLLQVEAWEPT